MSNNIKKVACIFGALVGIAIIIIGFKIQGVSFDPVTLAVPDYFNEDLSITTALNNITFVVSKTMLTSMKKFCEVAGWIIVSIGAIDTSVFVYKLCSIEKAPSSTENKTDNEIQ